MAYLEEQLSIKSVEAGVLKQNLNQKSDESTKLTSQISKFEEEKRSGLEEVEELKEKFQFQDDKQTKTIVALFAEREKLEKLFQQEKEEYILDSEQKIEGISAKLLSLEAANKFQISENERLKSLLKTSEEVRAKYEQESFIISTTLKETVKQAYSEIESQIGEIKQLKKEEEITRLQNLTSQLLSDSEKLRATISNLESDKERQFQTIRELTKELYVKTVELDEHKSQSREDRLHLLELIDEGEVKLERVSQESAAVREMAFQLEVEKCKEIDALEKALDVKTREFEIEQTSMKKTLDWYEVKLDNLEQKLVRKSQEFQDSLSRKTNDFGDLSQRFQIAETELQRSKQATGNALEALKKSLKEENRKVCQLPGVKIHSFCVDVICSRQIRPFN